MYERVLETDNGVGVCKETFGVCIDDYIYTGTSVDEQSRTPLHKTLLSGGQYEGIDSQGFVPVGATDDRRMQ